MYLVFIYELDHAAHNKREVMVLFLKSFVNVFGDTIGSSASRKKFFHRALSFDETRIFNLFSLCSGN
jgi:hypothetical protein